MKIEFIGPASLSVDDGVVYLAKVDGKEVECCFTYEALEDVDPDAVFGNALEHFTKHQLLLLSAAERKLLKGLAHSGKLLINSSDLKLEQ
ncbi:DUF1488 family protein [Polynucleobacter sp. AP-Reno-20A-A9]|uniref:DUF1488 family protein n=1 Tax=Polynucleobacter sp. AP-Reno-20A-A9 TaxID=2576925 RepID=UPI001C0DEFEF|nr:DUF1488 family protein [Polynucleobacter sp. AP-Reno-20A-A9]MBU3629104.1 DUF1488 family protein [Polynucleobacter sp. AP-Reno-20A-A9]